MPEATLLDISGIDIGDYAARNLTMTLEYIPQAAQMRRTVNGTLVDVSSSVFRKYRAVVTCTDQESPVFAGVPPGTVVIVTCIPHLGTNALTTAGDQEQLVLTMMVQPWQVSRQEWQAQTSWQLPLEEV